MAVRENPGDRDDMELINAEFESIVADLNLDQSSPRTYLDELDDLDKSSEIYNPRILRRGLRNSLKDLLNGVQRWWNKPPHDDSDGAVL